MLSTKHYILCGYLCGYLEDILCYFMLHTYVSKCYRGVCINANTISEFLACYGWAFLLSIYHFASPCHSKKMHDRMITL